LRLEVSDPSAASLADHSGFVSDAAHLRKIFRQTDGLPLNMREIINKIKNRTNSTWAIQADVPAIPVNPNTAAMMAIIRKTIA
jgi:hypothetical protein